LIKSLVVLSAEEAIDRRSDLKLDIAQDFGAGVLDHLSDRLDRDFVEILVEVATEYDQVVPVRAVGAGRPLDRPLQGQEAAGLSCRLLAVFILQARMSALGRGAGDSSMPRRWSSNSTPTPRA